VPTDAIQSRLLDIVAAEGAEAEDEALQILARRAGGSMRDSQSLLEQLLSFGQWRITVDDVHALLGTAQGGRLTALAERLQQRDAAAALGELDAALSAGVDAGQLAEQLLTYFRDMLVAAIGGADELLLQAAPQQHAALAEAGRTAGVQTLLATLQILDHALVRMRQSTQIRALLEMALVRICHLESLDELPALLEAVRQGGAGAAATPGRTARSRQKKTADPAPQAPPTTVTASAPSPDSPETIPWEPQRAGEIWQKAADLLQDMTRDFAMAASDTAISGPNKLVVIFAERYNLQKEACERPERKVKIEQALAQVTGRRVNLDLRMAALPEGRKAEQTRAASRRQLMRDAERHPVVTQAAELFNAEVVKVEPLRRSDRPDAP
jgi:DNA polymerase-3 subunit gamma/tau